MKQYLFLGLSWGKKKKTKSKCTSVKGTNSHALFSKAASRTILLSHEREEPNPALHQPTLKKKSNYLMKFNPTLEILTTYKLFSQCFSSANLLKLSVAEVCPVFFPHSKIASSREKSPIFLSENIFPVLMPSFLKTHILLKQPWTVLYVTLPFIAKEHVRWQQTSLVCLTRRRLMFQYFILFEMVWISNYSHLFSNLSKFGETLLDEHFQDIIITIVFQKLSYPTYIYLKI